MNDQMDPASQFKEWMDNWSRTFTGNADRPVFRWEVPTDPPPFQWPEDVVGTIHQPTIRRTVTPEGDEVLIVKAPYNAAFVDALKAEVDSDSRTYNPTSKTWAVDSAYDRLVRDLVDRHFGPNPNPSPPGASGVTLEHRKVLRAVQAKAGELKAQPTIEGLTAEVSRLTYELETERQRRATAEQQAKRIVHSAEVLTGELRRERARVAALERENDRLEQENSGILQGMRSSIFGGPSRSVPSPGLSDAYRVLGVTADLPLEIVEVVYRRLAARHHPDVGGDSNRMKQINQAMEKVRAAK